MGNDNGKQKGKKQLSSPPVLVGPKSIVLPEKQAPLVGERAKNFDALVKACRAGEINAVKDLLKISDLDINYFYEMKVPLYYACISGHIDIVNMLLADKRTNINGGFVFTPLYGACDHGNIALVELLLSHKNIQINLGTKVPLWIASKKGHFEIVRLLISRPELEWNTGSPSAITSALRADKLQVAELLIANTKYPESSETIRDVIQTNSLRLVTLLLENRIILNGITEINFQSLLSSAILNGEDSTEVLEHLLQQPQAKPLKGQDVPDGNPLLLSCIRNKKPKCASLLLGIDGIKFSPKMLHEACQTNNVDVVRVVLPFVQDSELITAGEKEAHRLLIESAQISIKSARKN